MRRQGGGIILNVASGLVGHPLPGISAYSAAKAAVVQFSLVLAAEEGTSALRVMAVHPGVVRTAVLEGLFGPGDARTPAFVRDRVEALGSGGQVIGPEQSARLFVFLATDAASDLAGRFVRYDDPAIQARIAAAFAA